MRMKNKLHLIFPLAAVLGIAGACHEPEFVEPTASRQGLTSLTAIITSGIYADQDLGKIAITDPSVTDFVIPIPYYYPEASNDETLIYMTSLRIQAELQPNWKISPKLGVVDLTEVNTYTLTDPSGNEKTITITGARFKPTACSLLSVMVEDVKTSGVIYEAEDRILIPYLEDLSAVSVSGQVSAHAKLSKINGKPYNPESKYNLNSGATVTVLAGDGTTTKTYTVAQGIPALLGQGLRTESVAELCNVDPVTMVGLPPYNDKCYVSLAGLGTKILVNVGLGRTPFVVDAFTGSKIGEMNLGGAVADCITNDDAGHVLLCNAVEGGDNAGEVKVFMTSSETEAPTELFSFVNPGMFPIGHRMKVLGDVTGDAVIVFTAEGIAGVSTTSEMVWLKITDGALEGVHARDFAAFGLGWSAAPVNFATVVPASLTPDRDGWFLDYYEGNSDPSVTHGSDDCYILHYIDGKEKDHWIELMGNWAINPNCLDIKTFNGARFMALFGVSHFPEWDIRPRLHLFEVTEPDSATRLFANDSMKIFQKGATDGEVGAAGDVVLVPSTDGYRLYVYYYDHHAQAIGAYVADCFEI